MKLYACIVAAVFATSNPYAQSNEDTVLGITLGKPIDRQLVPCAFGARNARIPTSEDWCIAAGRTMESVLTTEGISFLIPPDKGPFKPPSWAQIESRGVFFQLGPRGTVDMFSLELHPQHMSRAIDTVSDKFGQPTKSEQILAKTRGGGEFEFTSATWSNDAVTVRTTCTALDKCSVFFVSNQAMQRRALEREEQRKKDKL